MHCVERLEAWRICEAGPDFLIPILKNKLHGPCVDLVSQPIDVLFSAAFEINAAFAWY